MMQPELFERLLDLLWPEGDGLGTPPVFALLDGARDPRIEPMLRFSQRQYRCLYSGRLSPGLTSVAPYVVYLARDGKFTRELLEAAWGNSWGIFLVGDGDCTHEQVRRQFRKYLKVQDEAGKVYLFRFYDPRVLPRYLGACNILEKTDFFGPVTRFVVEDSRGAPLVLDTPRADLRPSRKDHAAKDQAAARAGR